MITTNPLGYDLRDPKDREEVEELRKDKMTAKEKFMHKFSILWALHPLVEDMHKELKERSFGEQIYKYIQENYVSRDEVDE